MKRTWEVILVINRNCKRELLGAPVRYMPVWIVGSTANLQFAWDLRTALTESSVPDITTFDDAYPDRPIDPSSLIDIIDLHHPDMTRLNIMGAESSTALSASMEDHGFVPTKVMWDATIAFKRPFPTDIDVPVLHLEATKWKAADDVYASLFAAVGAPKWHGRNFNALNDSIVTGDINSIEVPYRLVIDDLRYAAPAAQAFAKELMQLINELEAWGCPVSIKDKHRQT